MTMIGKRSYIITGGTGFLGSLFGVELLRRGHCVFFLGRPNETHNYEARQRAILLEIDPNLTMDNAIFYEANFDGKTLGLNFEQKELMKNTDGFFHFTADLSFKSSHRHRVRRTNLDILSHVMYFAKSVNAVFYFVSTAYVHGKQAYGTLIPETFLARPSKFHNAYEESKYDAEIFVKDWSAENDLKFAIFRPSIVVDRLGHTSIPFGFSSFLIGIEKLKRIFPRLMSGSLYPLLFPFPYFKGARLNLVPVDWVIHAILTISETNTVNGRIFNLTNPSPVSSKQIIEHSFGEGGGVKLLDFSAPAWFVHMTIFLLYVIGYIFRPLRVMSERVWLYKFCMLEANTYAMNHTNELLEGIEGPSPKLTNDELRDVAKHFIEHYEEKRETSRKRWFYKGVEISIDSQKKLKYASRPFLRSLLNFILVPVLNSIPANFNSLVSKTHHGANVVIKKAASHEAIETLYQSGYPHLTKNVFQAIARWIWFGTNCTVAAQNRLILVKDILKTTIQSRVKIGESIDLLSIASGSARAVVEAINDAHISGSARVHVTFLDKSPAALEYSTQLTSKLPKGFELRWVEDTASSFPKYFNEQNKPNIVEMVGLLDYFEPPQVVKVLSAIYQNMSKGGTMIIANISDNKERKFVTNLVGWKMVYRNAEELIDLALESGFEASKMRSIYEPQGIHHILVAIK
jgi:nucleoside-diphosphate-sugar epimerase